jgi:hypothetical protein
MIPICLASQIGIKAMDRLIVAACSSRSKEFATYHNGIFLAACETSVIYERLHCPSAFDPQRLSSNSWARSGSEDASKEWPDLFDDALKSVGSAL